MSWRFVVAQQLLLSQKLFFPGKKDFFRHMRIVIEGIFGKNFLITSGMLFKNKNGNPRLFLCEINNYFHLSLFSWKAYWSNRKWKSKIFEDWSRSAHERESLCLWAQRASCSSSSVHTSLFEQSCDRIQLSCIKTQKGWDWSSGRNQLNRH